LSTLASFTELLSFLIAAEKEKVALEHCNALEAQRSNAAELKDQLVQAGLEHARALKEAKAACEAKVDEALKDFADATGQLRKELEEETRLLQQAQDRNTELMADQAEFDLMVIDTDAQALSKCLFSHAYQLAFSSGVS
jgi:t-SNARE complex subunit (syntaxin)